MKNNITVFILMLLISLPVYADSPSALRKSNESKASGNPIMIYNHTNTDIAYVMLGACGGFIYAIERGGMDLYHASTGDNYATFEVGICKNKIGSFCYLYESLQNCVNNVHYNADHIKTIDVNSLTSCTVTCMDGSSTSCQQTG